MKLFYKTHEAQALPHNIYNLKSSSSFHTCTSGLDLKLKPPNTSPSCDKPFDFPSAHLTPSRSPDLFGIYQEKGAF